MSLFEDVMSLAVQMPAPERERLARALGVPVAAPQRSTLPMAAPDLSKTNPAAWRQAERGHAVLATSAPEAAIAPGPEALRGLFGPDAMPVTTPAQIGAHNRLASLPPGSPVVVHTQLTLALAANAPEVAAFFARPPVEIRLSTATYLYLLERAGGSAGRSRVRAFVQPYAVLSLGPMASSRAVELLLEGNPGLGALDGLIAATAMAHEIPLLVLDPEPFLGLTGLNLVVL